MEICETNRDLKLIAEQMVVETTRLVKMFHDKVPRAYIIGKVAVWHSAQQ